MAARWPTYVGAYAGLWLLSQAAKPAGARALSTSESNALFERLAPYRAPFGVPVAIVPDPVVVESISYSTLSTLAPTEMSAQVLIRQALDAERFVLMDSNATDTPMPSRFQVALVVPSAVRSFVEAKPDWVLFGAPAGYLSDGRPVSALGF